MSTINPIVVEGIISANSFGIILKYPKAPIKEPIINPAMMYMYNTLKGFFHYNFTNHISIYRTNDTLIIAQ